MKYILSFFPSLFLIIFAISILIYSGINGYMRKRFILDLIILSSGIILWLYYWLFCRMNKINKLLKALTIIISPLACILGYFIVWFVMQYDNYNFSIMWFYQFIIKYYDLRYF
jgi:cytochrome c oxidase subunit IV